MSGKVSAKMLSAALLAAVVVAIGPAAPAKAHGDLVGMAEPFAPGTIVVKTSERHLYFVVAPGTAIRYPVGVGRAGQQWAGTSVIEAKFIEPDWAPPPDIRRENPRLPLLIPGGSPLNPMGVAAMTLAGLDYAIHGTNDPRSIGHFVSHGCIRMLNEDVSELFAHVRVGTPVVVTR